MLSLASMGRPLRATVGGIVYHVLNRANDRITIFRKDKDYDAFEDILQEAKKKYPMRVIAYCLMPNHWHLILYPPGDADLPNFMRWITLTHTQRGHAHYKTSDRGISIEVDTNHSRCKKMSISYNGCDMLNATLNELV